MANHLTVLETSGGVNPWFVGVGIFVLLAIILLGLLIFGAGREHS